jgi:hypothetical protein
MTRRGAFELVAFCGGRVRTRRGWRRLAQWRCACGQVLVRDAETPGRDCGCGAGARPVQGKPSTIRGAQALRDLWRQMVRRCEDKTSPRYGGRGITVCARWRGDFGAFLADLGPREADNLSLDRIDNDGGYWCGAATCSECGPLGRPRNARWATPTTQGRNKGNNRVVVAYGASRCLAGWASLTGVPAGTIGARLERGWRAELAVSVPPRGAGR